MSPIMIMLTLLDYLMHLLNYHTIINNTTNPSPYHIPFPLPYIPHSQRWLPTLHTCVDSSLTLVLNISFDETPSPSSLPPNISNYHHSPPTIPSSNALSHTLTQVRLSTIRSYPSKLVPRSQHIFREWGKVRKPEDTFLTFHHLTWITTWVVTFMWG